MLDGHKNVVYAVAFNNPFADKIVTGSFDRYEPGLSVKCENNKKETTLAIN